MNVLLPDLRHDLLCDDKEESIQPMLKCPEITITFNGNITVSALVDTGSAVNGLSETWYQQNKQHLIPYEKLPMTNTLIVSAVGKRSKLIRKQILCDIYINEVKICLLYTSRCV